MGRLRAVGRHIFCDRRCAICRWDKRRVDLLVGEERVVDIRGGGFGGQWDDFAVALLRPAAQVTKECGGGAVVVLFDDGPCVADEEGAPKDDARVRPKQQVDRIPGDIASKRG